MEPEGSILNSQELSTCSYTPQKGKVIQRTDLKQMVANKLPPQKML
jgi:hypothetical protein